jgi:hypothetical protein
MKILMTIATLAFLASPAMAREAMTDKQLDRIVAGNTETQTFVIGGVTVTATWTGATGVITQNGSTVTVSASSP